MIPKLLRSTTLHYFSEVAEHGSFRAAAESLRIASSAINRQISNLEVNLGAKLFERTRGRTGLQLTDAGRILQLRLRAAINELRIASDEITALQGLRSGHVSIGVSEGLAGTILPDAISDFQKLHSNITFSIEMDRTPQLVSRLKAGAIDFAVGYDFPPDEDLSVLRAISLKLHAIVSVDHSLATRQSVSLADLDRSELIMSDGSQLSRQVTDPVIRSSDVRIKPIVETNSLELIHALAERGVGIGIVTGRMPRADGHGRLVHVEIDDAPLSHNVVACCKMPNRSLSAAAEAFAGTICEALGRWDTRQPASASDAAPDGWPLPGDNQLTASFIPMAD